MCSAAFAYLTLGASAAATAAEASGKEDLSGRSSLVLCAARLPVGLRVRLDHPQVPAAAAERAAVRRRRGRRPPPRRRRRRHLRSRDRRRHLPPPLNACTGQRVSREHIVCCQFSGRHWTCCCPCCFTGTWRPGGPALSLAHGTPLCICRHLMAGDRLQHGYNSSCGASRVRHCSATGAAERRGWGEPATGRSPTSTHACWPSWQARWSSQHRVCSTGCSGSSWHRWCL